VFKDPLEACKGADLVTTDVWTSMGYEAENEARKKAFADWCVDAEMMAAAKADALFMHCLPAHRGEEVEADVIDGPQSVVWDEAENRMHVQRHSWSTCCWAASQADSARPGSSAYHHTHAPEPHHIPTPPEGPAPAGGVFCPLRPSQGDARYGQRGGCWRCASRIWHATRACLPSSARANLPRACVRFMCASTPSI
jgi:hypothetical protein